MGCLQGRDRGELDDVEESESESEELDESESDDEDETDDEVDREMGSSSYFAQRKVVGVEEEEILTLSPE